MSGSFIFYFHLIGFSLVSAFVVAGMFLNRRFVKEKDLSLKLYVGGLMKSLNLFSPLVAALLLATGVGNIYNLYYGTGVEWYNQGWLVVKIILFAVMLVNGMFFGPMLNRKRMQIVKAMTEQTAPEESDRQLKDLDKQVNWFYVVQSVLLLGIIFFSAFGTSKHPGYF